MTFDIVTRDPEDFSGKLLSLKDRRKLCDVSLIINGERFDVHSNILSASSKFFENVFVKLGLKEFTFENIEIEAVQLIIEYCYTGLIKITEENVKDVFPIAFILSIPSIVQSCCRVLMRELSIENCLQSWKIGKKASFEELTQAAFKFVKENFKEISVTKDLLTLEYLDMDELICADINVDSEKTVYDAVKNWYQYDEDSRSENFVNLLDHVKLECLPNKFLISESRTLCKLPKCYDIFLKAMESQVNNDVNKCPLPDTLIAFAADSYDMSKIFEVFDEANQKWIQIDSSCNRQFFTIVLSDEKLLLIGGQVNNSIVNTVDSYDLRSGKLELYSQMIRPRQWASAVQYGNTTFVIGGYYDKALPHVEKFDSINKSWTEVTPIPTARYIFTACVFGKEIYVPGGRGINNEQLLSTDVYNISKNTWRSCASMQTARENFGIATIKDYLYVVGGYNYNSGHLKSVERYDPNIDKWIFLQSIEPGRAVLGIANVNGKLVIAGGHIASNGYLNVVEQYDEDEDKWNTMVPMNNSRGRLTLIKISGKLFEFLLSREIN